MFHKNVQRNFINLQIETIDMSVKVFELCEGNVTDMICVFKKQLCNTLEYKMVEFNLKMIHNILPCNLYNKSESAAFGRVLWSTFSSAYFGLKIINLPERIPTSNFTRLSNFTHSFFLANYNFA